MDNKTTRLAEIYKSEKSKGGGITSSLGKAALEKLDPRQIFNQKGFLASALPSLFKSYRATKEKKPLSNFISPKSDESSKKIMSKMEEMNSYLKIIAKESMNLSKIAIDTSILVRRSGLNNDTSSENNIIPIGMSGSAPGRAAKMLQGALRIGAAAMFSPAGIGILAGISAGFLAKILKEQNDIELKKPENADVPGDGKKAAANMRAAIRKSGLIEGTANDIVKRLIEDKLVGDAADKFCNDMAPGSNLASVLEKCSSSLKEKYSEMVAGLNAPTPAPTPAPTTVTGQVFNAQLGTAAGASNAIFAQTGMNPLAVPTLAPTTPSRQSNGKITYLPNTPTTPTPSGSQSEVRAIDNAIIKSQQAPTPAASVTTQSPIPPGAVTTESGSVVSTGSGGILTTSPTPASPEASKTPIKQNMNDILLNAIAGGESTGVGGYNAMNQGTIDLKTGKSSKNGNIVGSGDSQKIISEKLTDMTVGEIMDRAAKPSDDAKTRKEKGLIFAAGKYQIIPGTLKTLVDKGVVSKDDKFDNITQDKLGMALIAGTGALKLAAKGDYEGAQNALAKTWASIPLAKDIGDKKAGNSYFGDTKNSASKKSGRDISAALKNSTTGNDLQQASISVRDGERSSMAQTASPNTIVNNSPTTISNSSTGKNQIASAYDSDLFKAITGRAA